MKRISTNAILRKGIPKRPKDNIITADDMRRFLEGVPGDTPLCFKGINGSMKHGALARPGRIAESKKEPGFFVDIDERLWRKTRRDFEAETINVILID